MHFKFIFLVFIDFKIEKKRRMLKQDLSSTKIITLFLRQLSNIQKRVTLNMYK